MDPLELLQLSKEKMPIVEWRKEYLNSDFADITHIIEEERTQSRRFDNCLLDFCFKIGV